MENNLAKTYNPKEFEDRIYEMWEKSGAFRAERDPDKKPFTIVMPPPNITGQLVENWGLEDPSGQSDEVFTETIRRIEENVRALRESHDVKVITKVTVAPNILFSFG